MVIIKVARTVTTSSSKMGNRISVVIPAFNCAPYVASAIESVLAQIAAVHEIIVVNDGSTDETEKILKRFKTRIVYAEQVNAGPAAARTTGIARSTGDLIAFLDADDAWVPEKLARQLRLLERFPSAVLAYATMQNIGEAGQCLDIWPDRVCEDPADQSLSTYWAALDRMPPTSTVIVWADALRGAGGFDARLPTAEDLDLWVRLRALGPFVGVNEVLAYRRLRRQSLTQRYASSFQYRTYLRVAHTRRREINSWAANAYAPGISSIHTALANAYMREGRRGLQTMHAFLGAMHKQSQRRLAAALLGEGILGSALYSWLIRVVRNRSSRLNQTSSPVPGRRRAE